MIVEWFISMVLTLVGLLLSVLPVVSPAPSFSIGPVVGLMGALNSGMPITETVAGAALLLAAASASFTFGLVRQVWRFVPFIGGG